MRLIFVSEDWKLHVDTKTGKKKKKRKKKTCNKKSMVF